MQQASPVKTQPAPHLRLISSAPTGQPRTYRLVAQRRSAAQNAAYRKLAIAILGLDVASLAAQLRGQRADA
jgi:hypothetical protein